MFERVFINDDNVRGEVTVKLINDTTKKIEEEVKVENKISKSALQAIQLSQREIFFSKIDSNLNKSVYDKFGSGPYMIRLISGQFRDGQENTTFYDLDKRERVLSPYYSYENLKTIGGTVGHSFFGTYTGTSTLRGSLNLAESYATNKRIHIVLDWPTHASNGTISALGTFEDYSTSISYDPSDYNPVPLRWLYDTYYTFAPKPPDGKWLFGIAEDHNTGDAFLLLTNNKTNSESYFEVFKFGIDGTYTLIGSITMGSNHNKSRVKMTVINGNVFVGFQGYVCKVGDKVYGNTNFANFGLGFGSYGGYIYGLKDSKTVVKVDPSNMTVVESIDIGNIDTLFSNGVEEAVFNDRLSYFYKRLDDYTPSFFVVDLSQKRILSYLNVKKEFGFSYVAKSVFKGIPVFIDDYFNFAYNVLDVWSFVNLPSPVTKTSAQTLKIEYDFIFEF